MGKKRRSKAKPQAAAAETTIKTPPTSHLENCVALLFLLRAADAPIKLKDFLPQLIEAINGHKHILNERQYSAVNIKNSSATRAKLQSAIDYMEAKLPQRTEIRKFSIPDIANLLISFTNPEDPMRKARVLMLLMQNEILIPKISMLFRSDEEMWKFSQHFALSIGEDDKSQALLETLLAQGSIDATVTRERDGRSIIDTTGELLDKPSILKIFLQYGCRIDASVFGYLLTQGHLKLIINLFFTPGSTLPIRLHRIEKLSPKEKFDLISSIAHLILDGELPLDALDKLHAAGIDFDWKNPNSKFDTFLYQSIALILRKLKMPGPREEDASAFLRAILNIGVTIDINSINKLISRVQINFLRIIFTHKEFRHQNGPENLLKRQLHAFFFSESLCAYSRNHGIRILLEAGFFETVPTPTQLTEYSTHKIKVAVEDIGPEYLVHYIHFNTKEFIIFKAERHFLVLEQPTKDPEKKAVEEAGAEVVIHDAVESPPPPKNANIERFRQMIILDICNNIRTGEEFTGHATPLWIQRLEHKNLQSMCLQTLLEMQQHVQEWLEKRQRLFGKPAAAAAKTQLELIPDALEEKEAAVANKTTCRYGSFCIAPDEIFPIRESNFVIYRPNEPELNAAMHKPPHEIIRLFCNCFENAKIAGEHGSGIKFLPGSNYSCQISLGGIEQEVEIIAEVKISGHPNRIGLMRLNSSNQLSSPILVPAIYLEDGLHETAIHGHLGKGFDFAHNSEGNLSISTRHPMQLSY